MTIIEEIAAERARQISAEGWTPEHDDTHDQGEMAGAAAMYALTALQMAPILDVEVERARDFFWPWDLRWWKPTTPRRNLIKAAALIVAEIERLDRAARNDGGRDAG